MPVEIIVPDFNFSSFYYAEIIEALLEYKRKNIPEISNENPFETGVQILRAFALTGHLNNVLLDLTAQEVYLPSANVRENVVRILALIGFIPNADVPGRSTLRSQLTRTYTTSTLIVPDNALFGTRRRASTPSILFESDAAITINQTDEIDACWLQDEGGLWTDFTTEANGAGNVNAGAIAERALYIGHDSVFTDAIEFEGVGSFDPGDDRTATPIAIHFQYFDGEVEDAAPDSVAVQASNIKFYINDLLGTLTKLGSYAHVTVNSSGVTERLAVQVDGSGNFIETTAFLSQTTVSTSVSDYTVGTLWHDVQLATDTTAAIGPIAGETFDTGDGILVSFTNILDRFPLEPDTLITWTYQSGALPKIATYDLATGLFGGDANTGTSVNAGSGSATLEAQSVPDVGSIFVAYSRKSETLRQDGQITFLPPFNDVEDWVNSDLPVELRDTTGPTVSAFWFRILFSGFGAGTLSGFQADRVRWDQGGMYIRIPVTQGQTINETLTSGDGTPSQAFLLSDTRVIEDSVLLTIDGELWTQVEDFFASSEVDEHYTVTIDSDGLATALTGDGENGKVVPIGANNVLGEYRINADDDGNVGVGQIEISRSGLSRVKNTTNPRAAFGWIAQEGSDTLGLEKLKRDGVSSLRVLKRAVSPSDIEFLTIRWEFEGQKPFSRARAIENGFGLKTVKNIVVPVGGGTSSPTTRAALDVYFNGDINEGGSENGVLVANQQVKSIDFVENVIDVTVVVTGGSESAIRAAIIAELQPEATLGEDNPAFKWNFGQEVSVGAISAIIFNADPGLVTKAVFTSPAVDIQLADDELPKLGALDLEVI